MSRLQEPDYVQIQMKLNALEDQIQEIRKSITPYLANARDVTLTPISQAPRTPQTPCQITGYSTPKDFSQGKIDPRLQGSLGRSRVEQHQHHLVPSPAPSIRTQDNSTQTKPQELSLPKPYHVKSPASFEIWVDEEMPKGGLHQASAENGADLERRRAEDLPALQLMNSPQLRISEDSGFPTVGHTSKVAGKYGSKFSYSQHVSGVSTSEYTGGSDMRSRIPIDGRGAVTLQMREPCIIRKPIKSTRRKSKEQKEGSTDLVYVPAIYEPSVFSQEAVGTHHNLSQRSMADSSTATATITPPKPRRYTTLRNAGSLRNHTDSSARMATSASSSSGVRGTEQLPIQRCSRRRPSRKSSPVPHISHRVLRDGRPREVIGLSARHTKCDAERPEGYPALSSTALDSPSTGSTRRGLRAKAKRQKLCTWGTTREILSGMSREQSAIVWR